MAKDKRLKTKDLNTMHHSLSHIMAAAVLDMFPEAKLGIGPAIENGFYYDFDLPRTLIPEDLSIIEGKMREIIKDDLKFEKTEAPIKEAIREAKKKKEVFKLELLEDLKAEGEKKVGFFRTGDFVDLCSGPHVKSTSKVGAFKLTKISGAYWRGDEKNKMLQRIYGVAFDTEKELNKYLKNLEEAEKRDHRKLGKELDLFSFHREAPGTVFWHPKGMILREALMVPYNKLHKNENYQTISTPILLSDELWHKSGHWDNYKDSMYFIKIDDRKFAIKPMNCPGSILVYNTRHHSYKELPIKYCETGEVHRHEPSGTLHGLFRVRAFRQDDAHIFSTVDQVQNEIKKIIKLTLRFYKYFNFKNVDIEVSTRPDKSIGSEKVWNDSEKIIMNSLKNLGIKYRINKGEGAFYGPKIDFHINDSLGRSWQCGTIQLDFSMPERFDLKYIDKDGDFKKPVMIHRTIFGSIQRFVGILIEHYAGAFPLWLSPVQVVVIPISDKKHGKYARSVAETLKSEDLRAEVDDRSESLGRRIRDNELQKVPYLFIVGDKEMKGKKVATRTFKKGDLGAKSVNAILKELIREVEEKK